MMTETATSSFFESLLLATDSGHLEQSIKKLPGVAITGEPMQQRMACHASSVLISAQN